MTFKSVNSLQIQIFTLILAGEMMTNQKENQPKFIVFLLVNMIKFWRCKSKSYLSEVYLRPKVGSLHKAQGENTVLQSNLQS